MLGATLSLCAVPLRSEREQIKEADVERWTKELFNSGRWGPKDQIGTVNIITPAKRKEAAALVRVGLSICLAHDDSTEQALDNDPPLEYKMLTTGDQASPFAMDRRTEAYRGFGITHLDALCHMFHGEFLDNGFPRRSVTATGVLELAVINLKDGLFPRGILMDIPRLKGRPYLEPEEAIYSEDLDL
jgi:hypothetical protein